MDQAHLGPLFEPGIEFVTVRLYAADMGRVTAGQEQNASAIGHVYE